MEEKVFGNELLRFQKLLSPVFFSGLLLPSWHYLVFFRGLHLSESNLALCSLHMEPDRPKCTKNATFRFQISLLVFKKSFS